jgi:hypothetical protein
MAATPKGKGDFLRRLQGLVAETDEARAIQESIVSDKNQLIESMKVEHQNVSRIPTFICLRLHFSVVTHSNAILYPYQFPYSSWILSDVISKQ